MIVLAFFGTVTACILGIKKCFFLRRFLIVTLKSYYPTFCAFNLYPSQGFAINKCCIFTMTPQSLHIENGCLYAEI